MSYNKLVERIKSVSEGNYDTDVFKELDSKFPPEKRKLSPSELEDARVRLGTPDIRPMDFDRTFEAWLLRISLWGKIKIVHKNPEEKINKTMSTSEFLDYMSDDDRNISYGVWHGDSLEINKMLFYRKFWSIKGQEIKEEIIVEIDLRPDLKNRLKDVRKNFGIRGFFKSLGF